MVSKKHMKVKKARVTQLTQLMQGHETHFCGYWPEDYWCTGVKSVFTGKTLCTGIIPTAYEREYRTRCAHSACTRSQRSRPRHTEKFFLDEEIFNLDVVKKKPPKKTKSLKFDTEYMYKKSVRSD